MSETCPRRQWQWRWKQVQNVAYLQDCQGLENADESGFSVEFILRNMTCGNIFSKRAAGEKGGKEVRGNEGFVVGCDSRAVLSESHIN
jgi:hypothetical protein